MIILSRGGSSEEKYMKHAIQHNWWKADTTGKTNEQIFKELRNKPICPKCETIAMYHGSRIHAKCPKCGWQGRIVATLDEMLTEQMYRR